MRTAQSRGFTLIELLVAMSILMMIVVAMAQLFQHSTVAWESGYRRSRAAMVGRAILGYVTEDLRHTVWREGETPGMEDFDILDGTNGLKKAVSFVSDAAKLSRSGDLLYENTDTLKIEGFNIAFVTTPSNGYAEVSFTVKSEDKGQDDVRFFSQTVHLPSHSRYRFD